ncbi:MAG: flippase-like domain-containing protein [Bacteroidales bacterium]|nr:flippase-like domain-containing protein [Bacteroidales bacterium]
MRELLVSKKQIRFTLNAIVLIACIWLLFRKYNLEEVAIHTKSLNYFIFIVSVSISIVRIWLSGLRWETLYPDNDAHLSKWSYFRFSMLAHLFNRFMLGALGGDIIKTAYAVKEQKKKRIKSVIAVLVDRIVGLISIFVFGILALFMTRDIYGFDLSKLLFIFIAMVGFIVVLTNKSVLNFVERFLSRTRFLQSFMGKIIRNWKESLNYYGANRKKVFYSFILCIPIHLLSFVIFYIFSRSLGMDLTFFEIVFAIAIMWLITALPISIGGIGVRELSLIWLLGMFNVSSEMAITLSVMGYINGIIVSIIALPLLFDFRKKTKSHISRM